MDSLAPHLTILTFCIDPDEITEFTLSATLLAILRHDSIYLFIILYLFFYLFIYLFILMIKLLHLSPDDLAYCKVFFNGKWGVLVGHQSTIKCY